MNTDCTRSEDAAAFVSGELSEWEHADFSAHVAHCAACNREAAAIRGVISQLQAGRVKVSRMLDPEVLARVREEQRCIFPHPARWLRVAATAAVLALCLGIGAVMLPYRGEPDLLVTPIANGETAASVARALDWLCQNQEPDGSWAPEQWGGQARFKVALTALPVLALVGSDAAAPEHLAAAARATRWLRSQQTSNGTFGPDFQGAAYNHSIATLALLCTYRRMPDAETKRTLDAALAASLSQQTPSGGWGYLQRRSGDLSITEWQVEALRHAVTLGWKNAEEPLGRGRAWLTINPRLQSEGTEPSDSPSVLLTQTEGAKLVGAKVDFYRLYFHTSELQREHDAASRRRLAELRHTLLARQETSGDKSGSWPPEDRWSRAGGRIYSTSLASLSLQDKR